MELLAVLACLAGASGVILMLTGLTPSAARARAATQPPGRIRQLWTQVSDPTRRTRLVLATGTGLVTLLVTGWPIAALAVAAGAYAIPPMLSGREPARRITRLEALEQWARRLAEVMGASRGLEAALTDSLHIAPDAIRPSVAVLTERLNNHANTEHALRGFADDLNDPIADLIVTALILAAKRRGPGTRHALAALADAVADETRLRREVEAERASLRTTLLVIVISVTGLSVLLISAPTLSAPYSTTTGQLVMAAVALLYAGGLVWMKRLATITAGTRFLPPAKATDPQQVSR